MEGFNIDILTILLIPFIGTTIGAAFVFLLRDTMSDRLQKALLGFASGVMVAAAIWSLLIPAMEMSAQSMAGEMVSKWKIIAPCVIGFLLGMAFLLAIDELTPHLHIGKEDPEGPRTKLSRTTMLTFAVTIHNIPEGMATGVVIAGAMQGNIGISIAAATATALGIAIQNIPEGAIISLPLRAAGNSKRKSFSLGFLSGIVEPIAALLVIFLAEILSATLPFLLSFAAGAMLYVVIEELIPATAEGKHSNLSTIGFAIGFALMMVLDVVLA